MKSQLQSSQLEGMDLVHAGRAAFTAGDYEQSQRNFVAALALGIEEADCRLHLARIFNTWQDWQNSLEQWTWLRDHDPGRLEPHLQVGRACFRLGRLKEAAAEFQIVLRMAPGHAEATERLGALFLAQARQELDAGNHEAAERLILSALQRGIKETISRPLLAKVYEASSDWPKALEQWQWLHDNDRDDTQIRLNLGRVLVRVGRRDDARAHYEAILERDRQEQRAIIRLRDLLVSMAKKAFEIGNYRHSERDFRRALELGADESTCREYLAQIYSELKIWPKALEQQRWLNEARPGDLEGRVQYARLCFRANRLEEAKEAFKQALDSGADALDCHTSLARIYEEKKDWVNAAATWKAVLACDPARTEAYLRLAKALFALKRFEDAKEAFEEVLRLAPEQREARDGLVRLQAIVESSIRSPAPDETSWLMRLEPELRWSLASQVMSIELTAVRRAIQSARARAAGLAKIAVAYGVAEGPGRSHRELFRVQADPALSEVEALLRKLAHQLGAFEQKTARVVEAVAQEAGYEAPPRAQPTAQVPAPALARALVRDALLTFRRHGLDRAVESLICRAEFEDAQDLLMEFAAALQELDLAAAARVYSMAYAVAPTEATGSLALQIASRLEHRKPEMPVAAAQWRPFQLAEPLPAPRYLLGDVAKVARWISQIVLRNMTERIAKLGVARSGAGEHYAQLVKSGNGIVDHDVAAARFLLGQFGTTREVHDIGSGIGSLALLLAAMGVSVVGIESQAARYQACIAAHRLFKEKWDRPAASLRFVQGRFPKCVSDADLSDKVAVLMGFIASVAAPERRSIIAGLRRYAGVLIDTYRFLTPLKQEEDQERLLMEFQKAGFKHFYEVARSASYCLVLATTGNTLGIASAAAVAAGPSKRAAKIDDQAFETMLKAVLEKGGAGEADAATALLRAAFEEAAGSFDRLMLAGEAALDVDDLDAAAHCYVAALNVRPESDRALCRKAQVAEARGELEVACAIWKKACELRPDVSLHRFNYLRLRRDTGGAVSDADILALMTHREWVVEGMFAAAALRGSKPTWSGTRRCLNSILDVHGLSRFTTGADEWQGLESLCWDGSNSRAFRNDGLVTIVVPSYNASSTIVASVQSIFRQKHSNVEVIVVDDASTDGTFAALKAAFGNDPRLKIERHARNRGAYAAINTGLAVATGEYVCIQGADDVSHPQRLQLQLAAIENAGRVASLCRYVRISEQGTLLAHSTGVSLLCDSSLIFKREVVLGRLGFMDDVRVGADTEFRLRLHAAFGKESIEELREPLYFALSRSDSLTGRAGLGRRPYGGSGTRRRYSKAFQAWHRQIEQGASPYVGPSPRARPFTAPAQILSDLGRTSIASQ